MKRSFEGRGNLVSHDAYSEDVITRLKEVSAELEKIGHTIPKDADATHIEQISALAEAQEEIRKAERRITKFSGKTELDEIKQIAEGVAAQFKLPSEPPQQERTTPEAPIAQQPAPAERLEPSESEILKNAAAQLEARVLARARDTRDQLMDARRRFLELYRDTRAWRTDDAHPELDAAARTLSAAYQDYRNVRTTSPSQELIRAHGLDERISDMTAQDKEIMDMLADGYDKNEPIAAYTDVPPRSRITMSDEEPPASLFNDHRSRPPKKARTAPKQGNRFGPSAIIGAFAAGLGAGFMTDDAVTNAPRTERTIERAATPDLAPEPIMTEPPAPPRETLRALIDQFPEPIVQNTSESAPPIPELSIPEEESAAVTPIEKGGSGGPEDEIEPPASGTDLPPLY